MNVFKKISRLDSENIIKKKWTLQKWCNYQGGYENRRDLNHLEDHRQRVSPRACQWTRSATTWWTIISIEQNFVQITWIASADGDPRSVIIALWRHLRRSALAMVMKSSLWAREVVQSGTPVDIYDEQINRFCCGLYRWNNIVDDWWKKTTLVGVIDGVS